MSVNPPQAFAQVLPYLPLGWNKSAGSNVELHFSLLLPDPLAQDYQLWADTTLLAHSQIPADLLTAFHEHAQLETILRARDRLFVHAGVVGWHGQAILIPGRSHSGKTTLVRALLEHGATYYSDEYAVLDARGNVHPYPLPLSIRSGSTPPVKTSVEQLGAPRGSEPLPVRLIVVTQYQPHARWLPRPLSPAYALLALMDNTVAARREPNYTMPILRETVMCATTVTTKRGDAQRTARAILKLVSA